MGTYHLYRITTSDYAFWYGAFSPAHALQRWFLAYGDTEDEEEIEIEHVTEARPGDEVIVNDDPIARVTVWDLFQKRKREHEEKGDTSKPHFSIATAFVVAWPSDL